MEAQDRVGLMLNVRKENLDGSVGGAARTSKANYFSPER